MDVLNALLGNGSVNTRATYTWSTTKQQERFLCGPRHATVEVFSVVRATRQLKCFLCGLRHATVEVFSM
jgi:hypothetical protein